jgi:hypothetical protein
LPLVKMTGSGTRRSTLSLGSSLAFSLDYSSDLVQVLDRSDSQLGLVVVKGKEGGYRGVVMQGDAGELGMAMSKPICLLTCF